MIEGLRTISLRRRHPRSAVFSDYIDGDLDDRERRAVETHLRDCHRCRRELASLANIVGGLGSLEASPPSALADSVIAALRAEDSPAITAGRRHPRPAAQPWLTIVPGPGPPRDRQPILSRWPQEARTALRWCLQRRQLRLTLPNALIAGVVLSVVNMGGMLMHGRIGLGVCLSCAADFLVPFLALNLALLMMLRLPRRRRL